MFDKEVYQNRRSRLAEKFTTGLLFFPGNHEASLNYPANTYHYRQDSSFLYFFGLDMPGLAGIIDIENDDVILFGNDVDIDDIIWMGPQPKMNDLAASVGINKTLPLAELDNTLKKASASNRDIHFLPPYRGETIMWMSDLLGIPHGDVRSKASPDLIKAVVDLRSVKDRHEIEQIEMAVDTCYEMHTTAMKMAKPGVYEREIAGAIEGISLSYGNPVSFPVILTINGQTLHNHYHGNMLKEGRMLVVDAGAESPMHYAGDITRTTPVGGKFNAIQKSIYEIVLKANMATIEGVKPGVTNKSLHLIAARTIAEGLKEMGLMKGDMDAAVKAGAHALFFPHGLGHMMGLDVHDMEGLGENYVGYDDKVQRADQFGLAYLRLGRELKEGFVLTIEPGIYFIPALIDQWQAENRHGQFLNYDEIGKFRDFGGVRIEDDILVTDNGYRVLGKPIPKTVKEIESLT